MAPRLDESSVAGHYECRFSILGWWIDDDADSVEFCLKLAGGLGNRSNRFLDEFLKVHSYPKNPFFFSGLGASTFTLRPVS